MARNTKQTANQPRTDKAVHKGKTSGGSHRACLACPALCCHDLAIPINRPRLREDIDDLKWQLRYDNVHVAVRHRQWYLVVNGRCIYLDSHNRCRIYADRPATCRDHNPPECEKYGRWYECWIESPDQLEQYLGGRRTGSTRPSRHCSRGRLLNQDNGEREAREMEKPDQ